MRILSADTTCSTTAGARGRVIRRRPATGNRTPTPSDILAGGAQLTGGTRLAAAREGHPALPTPLQGSAQTEGLRGLYRVIARDSAGPSRPAPWRRAGAQSRIVRVQDEPRRPQNLLAQAKGHAPYIRDFHMYMFVP